ncbi:hypothetical protein [Streptomyces fagopyri]
MTGRDEWQPGLRVNSAPVRPPTRVDEVVITGRPFIVVLARDETDFREWCIASGVSERDRDVIYASDIGKLRGITHAKVLRCLRWYDHPDSDAIGEYARTLDQRSR